MDVIYRSTTDDETAKCVKETVCFERVCDFNVNSFAKKTREQCFVPFVFFPKPFIVVNGSK